MGKDDSVQQYYLKMKELSAIGNIAEALDLDIYKMMLYGSRNLKQFKEKLKLIK